MSQAILMSMRVWTIQTTETFSLMDSGKEFRPLKPEDIHPNIYQWFMKHTRFDNWPVACWLNLPAVEDIDSLHTLWKKLSQPVSHSFVLLELNVPNNERMLFTTLSAWEHLLNYWYLDHKDGINSFKEHLKERLGKLADNFFSDNSSNTFNLKSFYEHDYSDLHERIYGSWEHIFDLNWCKQYLGDEDIQVFIPCIHPHWIESSYFFEHREDHVQSVGAKHNYTASS